MDTQTEEIVDVPEATEEVVDTGDGTEMYAEALAEAEALDDMSDELDADLEGEGEGEGEGETEGEGAPETESVEEDVLVQVSSKQLDALLARVEAATGIEAPAPEQEPAAAAPEEAAQPEVQEQTAQQDFTLPTVELSEDEHYAVLSDPGAFNQYIQQVQSRTAEAVIAQIQPMLLNSTRYVQAAMAYEQQFFAENPELAKHPQLVNRAIAAARAKNPKGSFEDWGNAAKESLREVIAIRQSLEKHGRPRDVRGGNRGRFAPSAARRTPQTPQSKTETDPTQQALQEIAGLSGGGAELIRGLGVV